MVHIVTYDLVKPHAEEGDYARVIEGLKATYPTWCHLEKSVWLVVTEQSATEVRDALRQLLFNSDILFVGKLSGSWGSLNIGPKRAEWLKGRTF